MLAIRIEQSLVNEVETLAKLRHTSRSSIIREAIIKFLEDNEDLKLAKESQKKMKSRKTLTQIRKDLGLDG